MSIQTLIASCRLATLSHPRLRNAFVIFETLILVDFSRGAGQLLPLQDRQQALVDTNVLLLGLDHPNALFTHRVDYAENVDVVGYEDLLQDAIQADEGTGATHAGAATRISRRL
jgi:hypothetical protein